MVTVSETCTQQYLSRLLSVCATMLGGKVRGHFSYDFELHTIVGGSIVSWLLLDCDVVLRTV